MSMLSSTCLVVSLEIAATRVSMLCRDGTAERISFEKIVRVMCSKSTAANGVSVPLEDDPLLGADTTTVGPYDGPPNGGSEFDTDALRRLVRTLDRAD